MYADQPAIPEPISKSGTSSTIAMHRHAGTDFAGEHFTLKLYLCRLPLKLNKQLFFQFIQHTDSLFRSPMKKPPCSAQPRRQRNGRFRGLEDARSTSIDQCKARAMRQGSA